MEATIEENHNKNASPNHIFFACVFLSILERFWEGFGRVLGGVWELLGVSWGTFKPLFLRLCGQEGPRGGQEASRVRFGMDLGGFWEGSGRVLEVKIDVFFGFSAWRHGLLMTPPHYWLDVILLLPVETHENPSAKNSYSFRMFDTFQ